MTKKTRKKAYDFFYHQMDMPGRLTYIKKVMESCRTRDQLDLVQTWGCKRLVDALDQVSLKFAGLDSIPYMGIFNFVYHRVGEYEDEVNRLYRELRLKME